MKTRLRIVVLRKDSEDAGKLKEYLNDMGLEYEVMSSRTDSDMVLIGFDADRITYDHLEKKCELKDWFVFY